MSENTVFYFAYGSNLSKEQMIGRLGRLPPSRIGRLTGHRIAFNKRGSHQGEVYANLVQHDGGEVWGVVYELAPAELQVLDYYEGVEGGHYRRHRVDVLTEAGVAVNAETYFAEKAWLCAEARPSRGYAARILTGAREHALPNEYIRSLEQLTGTSAS